VTVRTILGRLSDLGFRELLRLLASASAEGSLVIENPSGRTDLSVRGGEISGPITPPLVQALALRAGSFNFRPGPVGAGGEWLDSEDFIRLVEARATGESVVAVTSRLPGGEDALSDLRDSLAEVPLPGSMPRIHVIAADPRPYRAVEAEWRQHGWELVLTSEPVWPGEPAPNLVILHLPGSGTLAGQGDLWLAVVREAAAQRVPVPVLWVGGLADPELRHRAVTAGAEFLLPAPMGEVGETARWFRDELTLLAERFLARRAMAVEGSADAFRDFFLALHADASAAELCASLLRIAGAFFERGVLFAVRERGFESLGGYGQGWHVPTSVPRGVPLLEDALATNQPARCTGVDSPSCRALAEVLGTGAVSDAEAVPMYAGTTCVALFVGSGPIAGAEGSASLARLLAHSGGLLGL